MNIKCKNLKGYLNEKEVLSSEKCILYIDNELKEQSSKDGVSTRNVRHSWSVSTDKFEHYDLSYENFISGDQILLKFTDENSNIDYSGKSFMNNDSFTGNGDLFGL